jgi:hypothetical protein
VDSPLLGGGLEGAFYVYCLPFCDSEALTFGLYCRLVRRSLGVGELPPPSLKLRRARIHDCRRARASKLGYSFTFAVCRFTFRERLRKKYVFKVIVFIHFFFNFPNSYIPIPNISTLPRLVFYPARLPDPVIANSDCLLIVCFELLPLQLGMFPRC